MKAIEFLIKYQEGLSLNGIEDELGIPKDSLRFAIKGNRKLPVKHEISIAKWFDLEVPVSNNPAPKKSPTLLPMKSGEWKPSLRGYWTNGVISRIPVINGGVRYYSP